MTNDKNPKSEIPRSVATPQSEPDEGVERRLARFAFVREERDREVRLLFRNVPPVEIAAAFWAAGAMLISIAGERMLPAVGEEESSQVHSDSTQSGDDAQQADTSDKGAERATQADQQTGGSTFRYFFDLDEIVYTVIIDLPSSIVGSVANVYPSARVIEDEIQRRLGATFI